MKIMKNLQGLLLVFILLFTSFFQVGNVFAQEAQPIQSAASSVGITYQTHVQNMGTMDWMSDGALSGTEGQGLRMEGMKINLTNAPANASIDYYCHVQNIGDQKPDRKDGELAGTEGQGLRLEALHIILNNMPGYSVQYRVHVQNDGWQDWVSDGAIAGTESRGLRLEAVEIRIVKTSPGVQATSVSLDTATAIISAGTTQTLAATVLPADATNKDVTWTSDNTAMATVDNNGQVTGISEGTANIVATTVDGDLTAGCAVTVTPAVATVPVTAVSLNQIAVNITKDASRSLIATVMPANATNKDVTWTSDNTAVATVDDIGKVTGIKVGTAIITGITVDGGLAATCNVTVKNPAPPAPVAILSSIAVTTPATKLVYTVGDSLDLTGLVVTGTYSDGTTKTKTVKETDVTGFDSSAPVVDQILTITIGGKTTTCTITIPAVELTGWIIDRDCLGKNVPTMHKKMCNLMGAANTPPTSCYASGLGIYTNISEPEVFTSLANYQVFDEESRALTKTFLENLPGTWTNNVTVKVTGYNVNDIPANLDETNVPETDSTKIDHYLAGFHVTSIEAAFLDGISTNALPSPNLVLPGSVVRSSIAITAPATKLTYAVGEPLDMTGLEVTGTYSDNLTQVEPITAASVKGFDSSAPVVDQVLTVTIGGKTATYTVSITSNSANTITAFSFEGLTPAVIGTITGTDIVLDVPDGADVTALVATFTNSAASAVTVGDVSQFSGTTANDFSSPVTYTVTALDGTIANYTINVVAAQETLTFEGYIQDQDCFIQYAPYYGDDSKDCLLMQSCAASGYGITALQDDGTFKFYYFDGDFATMAPFKVGTGSQLNAWDLISNTSKDDHVTISVTGTLDGSTKISPFDGLSYPMITVTSLEEVTTSPVLTSIAITAPATKLEYTVGDDLDINGLNITSSYADNSSGVPKITAADVTGFDSSAPATDQELTVTYGEKTAIYTIDILAPVPEILTFEGFIQDQDCFISYAGNWGADTKPCLLMHSCAASGYGITALQSNGTYKFYYFDGDFAIYSPWTVGTGSQLIAWNFANATTKMNNITGLVTGTLDGTEKISPDGISYPVINVLSLTETN
ncbi:MAG: Ig-like domain-containing protein [Acetobacterium sp.]